MTDYPTTPDGRYFVVRGRLWRKTNPDLDPEDRQRFITELMSARRAVRTAGQDRDAMTTARAQVNAVKIALGERGPVWWNDGAPDLNRHMARTTPYADWWSGVQSGER